MLQLLEYEIAAIITPTKTFDVFLRNAWLKHESQLTPPNEEGSQDNVKRDKSDCEVIEIDMETTGQHCTYCKENLKMIHQEMSEMNARIKRCEIQGQSQ